MLISWLLVLNPLVIGHNQKILTKVLDIDMLNANGIVSQLGWMYSIYMMATAECRHWALRVHVLPCVTPQL